MPPERINDADMALRNAIQTFVSDQNHPDVARFQSAIANWTGTWRPVAPCYLRAADDVPLSLAQSVEATHPLLCTLNRYRNQVKWEQTYTKADQAISDAMLARYGFVEVIGKNGPFVSERVRSGIGVYGPEIQYPPHRHAAEEVYIPLAGTAEFRLAGRPPRVAGPGDVIYVSSNLVHGFCTSKAALVVFYIWQAGDLREVSTFV